MKTILLLFTVFSTFALQAQQVISQQPTVMVNGEGIIKIIPDQVLIQSRIENVGEDAQEVKKKNDASINEVIKFLKAQGIPETHIKTDYVSLRRDYNYDNKTYSYVANQAISIKLENLANYESIMSGLMQVGLNRIDGVQFMSSQMENHKTEARRRAVLDAKKKANEYAAALDQNIGKAISISETEINNFPPVYRMEMMKTSGDDGSSQTIAPGEMEVSARVTVAFLLN